MTLISEESEKRIERILATIASSYAVFMIGRGLGQTNFEAVGSALTARQMTFLEQSFLAGRIASEIGTDKLRGMSQADIASWVSSNNVSLNETELATLRSMRRDTERWIQGRSERWQQRFRTAMAVADKDWRGVISEGAFRDAQARTVARNSALNELMAALSGENESFKGDVDRLLQTEMHSYFQQGQIMNVGGDEEVYKIPRSSACQHCLRLHLNKDGSPRIYRLSEVVGNTNWGKKAHSWQFTIGPTHPYCYCILYRVTDKSPSGPSKKLAAAMEEKLRKSSEPLHINCDCAKAISDPQDLFERPLNKSEGKKAELPEHQMMLVAVLTELYGSTLPTLEGQQEKY